MVFVVLAVGLFASWFMLRRARKKRNRTLASTPGAGFDTGLRSAYRTPGRLFGPRRGF